MILHTIAPFREEFKPWYNGYNGRSSFHGTPVTSAPAPKHKELDKLEYAEYQKTLSYKAGDLVEIPWGNFDTDFTVWKIVTIEEIHHLLIYDNKTGDPKPYYVMSPHGMSRYASEKEITKLSTVDPKEWEQALRKLR